MITVVAYIFLKVVHASVPVPSIPVAPHQLVDRQHARNTPRHMRHSLIIGALLSLAHVVLLEHLLRNAVEQFLGEDAKQGPGQV